MKPIVQAGLAVLAAGLLASCTSGAKRPPVAPPAQTERPTTQELSHSSPDDAPARVPTATPPPTAPAAPAKPAPGKDDGSKTTGALREILPGVRADLAAKVVEFDGIVPMDCHDPKTPDVFLEVTVCTPDTKEHESLVMTRAKASNVHAALLAIGLEPGGPGRWNYQNKTFTPVPPRGSPVEVTIAYTDGAGQRVEAPATDWVINAVTRAPFAPSAPGAKAGGFVFAGSKMATHEGHEVYDADGVGTLVGLTTFGSETIAWKRVISPDSSLDEPEWIADPAKVPAYGTPVTVRIRALPRN